MPVCAPVAVGDCPGDTRDGGRGRAPGSGGGGTADGLRAPVHPAPHPSPPFHGNGREPERPAVRP
ncbi:hypothetical protein GCM10010301_36330 [Streptomyces plicatus]|nr:hypothetical protein GCM10010301_36330 [Streptomyces plicatus]